MFRKIVFLLTILTGSVFLLSAAPRTMEIRKESALNPTLYFSGVSGNSEITGALRSFLGICGWFDLTGDAAKADYTLTAENAGSTLRVTLLQGNTPMAAWQFSRNVSARELAKAITDTVIEKAFQQLKVRGFCRSRIAFTAQTASGIRNIFICDIDGAAVEQITNYRCLNVEPAWSPDGKSIFFSKYNSAGIQIIETTVGKPRRSRLLTSFRGINTGAAVNPDGERMAVILSPDHQVDLYVITLHGKSRNRLTKGIAVEASPCWSPDGRQIAFVSDRSGSPRIYIANADGSGAKAIPSIGSDAVTPAWSKDGKIAYAARVNGVYTIAVYDLNSGENKRITEAGGSWESPDWAADNRQLVCKRTDGGNSALYVLDTRTGKERLLIRTGSRLFDPAWSPCRKK